MFQIQEDIPEGKQLLEDTFELEYSAEDLHEATGDKKPYLKGRLGLVDIATANRRVYPRNLMVRETTRLAPDMVERKVYGELGHPSDGKTNLDRVSHFVLEAKVTDKGEILGVIEFIPGTKNGDQALAIARAGGKLGVSSRGFGSTSTNSKGEDIVQEDYKLVTWDIVADPANAGAHPPFVMEHKENDTMDLNQLKKEHPDLVEALTSEITGKIEEDARTHAREAMREEFEERLQTEGNSIREEAVKVARSQLLKDPEVAGAATAISEIKKVVTPFILSEDGNIEVKKLQEEIRKLHQKIADQDEALAEARGEAEELSGICKELGYHLYLERELGDNERAEQIVEMLGDVTEYENLDSLKERVNEIAGALAEDDKVRDQYEERIAALEKQLSMTEDQRDKALNVSRQFGIRAYIERKIADNPKAPVLRNYLNEAAPQTKEEVDKLVETYMAANPLSEDFKRIRKDYKGQGPRKPREEDGGKRTLSEETVMGVPMSELQKRSGIQTAAN